MLSEWLYKFRSWRLLKAELSLADWEHEQRRWGFAHKPSEAAWIEQVIKQKYRKVNKLRTKLGRPTIAAL